MILLITYLQEKALVPEAASWAASRALKLSAMFRHMAQEALNCRKWVPEELGYTRLCFKFHLFE